MADLTKQKILESGLAPTMVAAAGGGDAITKNVGNVFFMVVNGGAGSINVTATVQNADLDSDSHGEIIKGDRVVAVGVGETKLIGPFARGAFNDINGKVQITYSGVTSLTVAALYI